jgi:acyl-lipid Delta6-acetylenase / acyl-lipid (9-3)-desaturase
VCARSPLYYVYKTATTLLWGVAGTALLAQWPGQWWAVLSSAACFGVLYQQCGWLSHDYVHHQVFGSWRGLGNAVGLVVGNVLQGFSVDWWKNKHNSHHAIPNLHESAVGRHDGDPDVDTLPVLAWSGYFARRAAEAGGLTPFLVRNQWLFFWPALTFARFAWMDQSFRWVFGLELGWGVRARWMPLALGVWEPVTLLLHYAMVLALSYLYMTPLQALAHFFLSNALTGVILAAAFVVGHNGMRMVDAAGAPDFAPLQLYTTRNIHDDPLGLVGWFMGGLQCQIEHHLFPSMPRHSLPKAQPFVEALCRKHNLPYHTTHFFQGLHEVMNCLDDVATQFVKDFPAA